MNVNSETATVVKRILPYLIRRGYDIENDIDFETKVEKATSGKIGFVDLVVVHNQKPAFCIEAKKASKKLTNKDVDQAIEYGRSKKVPFVVVTNGKVMRTYNVTTEGLIRWNGQTADRIPSKADMSGVLTALRSKPFLEIIDLKKKEGLPFRPGLPLRQLNALFQKAHNTIRKIEKNEERAFDDFSKLLFLKLLEEKADDGELSLPYSYRFHELAAKPDDEADQIKDAVRNMIAQIKSSTSYSEVLREELHLKNSKTFASIIRLLSTVSFRDSNVDSKGAAFEYFVRATLKGKKLGQYFTPRQVVRIMNALIGPEIIPNTVASGTAIKVLDPACGTGGFLVFLLQEALQITHQRYKAKIYTAAAKDNIVSRLKTSTFYGGDANEGVAAAAKMNMIVAGDGHNNIRAEDTLALGAKSWSISDPDVDIIVSNPPFGTSETDSLEQEDFEQFPLKLAKGQQLFMQKMMLCLKPQGVLCTVIDDGFLNTSSSAGLRRWLLEQGRLRTVVRLPAETFKPNKINVRASVLLIEKYSQPDLDGDSDYIIDYVDIKDLGYFGSGEIKRGFNFSVIEDFMHNMKNGAVHQSKFARQFPVRVAELRSDPNCRFDLKYWEPSVIAKISEIEATAVTIEDLNTIETRRGRSPAASLYVDRSEGYACVIKAGSSISKFGEINLDGDWVEKDTYEDLVVAHVQKGDVLVSSTGQGTLGKVAVYGYDVPAIADSHVSIIRPPAQIDPNYLADYLRVGFGSEQIERVFTGSTGLIELTGDDLDTVLVERPHELVEQIALSADLRAAEGKYNAAIKAAQKTLETGYEAFRNKS